jgi:hypothetical protein
MKPARPSQCLAEYLLGIMCAPKSKSYRAWKGLFLTAETFALLGCLYALTWIVSYRYYSRHGIFWSSQHISVRLIAFCEHWMRPMLWSFIAALLILLIVSPFFVWSSLRPAAVKAWIIGVVALACVGYILFTL